MSAICLIAASGEILKSTFIGMNQNLKEYASKCTFYGNIVYRSAKNAFIANKIIKEYIVSTTITFIEEKREKVPFNKHKEILIVDGPKSHFSDDISAYPLIHRICFSFWTCISLAKTNSFIDKKIQILTSVQTLSAYILPFNKLEFHQQYTHLLKEHESFQISMMEWQLH